MHHAHWKKLLQEFTGCVGVGMVDTPLLFRRAADKLVEPAFPKKRKKKKKPIKE